MKNIKYIFILLASVLVSCVDDPLQIQFDRPSSDTVELVARILPFDERDVATRAEPDNFTFEEGNVKMMDFIIFNSDGVCVFYGHLDGDNLTMTLDRSVAFAGMDQNKLNSCDIYTVANFPENYNGIVSAAGSAGVPVEKYIKDNIVGVVTEAFLGRYSTNVTGINIPTYGLPMVGKAEGVDLSEDAVYSAGHMITVETRILFSKMVFNINVIPEQVVPGIEGNMFKISKYEVYNLAQTVDVTGGTESAPDSNGGTNDETAVYGDPFVGTLPASLTNNYLTDLSFTFYLPERFVRPATSASDYDYPFRQGDNSIREEDKNLRQRFKPKLVEGQSTPATYVKIYGTFLNHQGHAYDLVYDIYVGNDNYGNFDIVRSRQYNNNLTIRGIQNNNDQPLIGEGEISVDHRVDVQRSLPIIVGIRRETLLDAHWEVRPLRIRANQNSVSYVENSACKVEITYLNGETTPWIGLEPSYGDGSTVNAELYCTGANSSAGKRKYFTTNLVTSTLKNKESTIGADGFSDTGGQSVVVPVSETSNDCVWVYIDECTQASQDIDAKRSAKITITYGLIDATTKKFKGFDEYSSAEIQDMKNKGTLPENFEIIAPVEYTFMQHLLYTVTTTRKEYVKDVSTFPEEGIYYIEHEEEYLHNFDTEDGFILNPTQDNGMVWGLEGIPLSHTYPALYLDAQPGGIIMSILQVLGWSSAADLVNNSFKEYLTLDPKYDFYLSRDTNNENLEIRDFSGYNFNSEIVNFLLANYASEDKAKLNGIQLDEQPKSAVAYCYNKNKRNADGTVEKVEWYLPAIDEIEDIMEKEYGAFNGVFQENKYWSCQPAYDMYDIDCEYRSRSFSFTGWNNQKNITGTCYIDNTDRARATMAERESGAFKDVISSGSELSGKVEGRFNITEVLPNCDFDKGNWTLYYPSYDEHPGNMTRDSKARVRCVRKMD